MRGTLLASVLQAVVFWVLGWVFVGVVLVTLPFPVPWPLTLMTHRGIAGEDYKQCGWLVWLLVFNTVLRPRIVEVLVGKERDGLLMGPAGKAVGGAIAAAVAVPVGAVSGAVSTAWGAAAGVLGGGNKKAK